MRPASVQSRGEHAYRSLLEAQGIANDAWDELRRTAYVQSRLGAVPTRLPEVSLSESERRSAVGRLLLKRLHALDANVLPHDIELTMRLVRFRAQYWSREADWYWTLIDPYGLGQFGMFLPTAYCGGYLLTFAQQQLASFVFQESGDLDRYLGLVADYVRLIDQFSARTAGQSQRGFFMPKAQVLQARSLLAGFRLGAREAVEVSTKRLAKLPASSFLREVEARIVREVEPAYDRSLSQLSDEYLRDVPEEVGIRQYPSGDVLYSELVKHYTTLDLTPEQIHAQGHERMSAIEAAMQDIRRELRVPDEATFLAKLDQDPRWRADSVDGVTAVFQRYIDRVKPCLDTHFSALPGAGYSVAPLSEALQGSMTFGYYDAPRIDRDVGLYLFNSANLTRQSLFNIAALTYHELMPGHHLQFAVQQENQELHPFRRHSFVTAFAEGWAEYAATLAGEVGMYEEPEERYGRLVMDAFLTSRLVVDTGMNALGWSLEKARDYMRKRSGMPEATIATETVRYSCDIPGQALAYKLGDTQILSLRERMRGALGARFRLKDFHAAVVGPGALPFPDLGWHIEHEIARLREQPAP